MGSMTYVSEKVRVLEGDVHASSLGLGEEDLAELSREVDVVIHSAASVIFDAPLDAAVDSNVRGTLGLLKLARGWEKRPLFMHISTAYVAGMIERGRARGAAWRLLAERDCRSTRARRSSTWRPWSGRWTPPRRSGRSLRRFETEARRELGMVGEEDEVAERVDQLRRAWMRERLVERGTLRARELGWNDVYTFTKSLAERMAVGERGEAPLVILRPAIIESSHGEPYPGWIQGTRMADPIIMAFAKGILREFPGNPKSYVDIVPVDHVVNAILAAGVRRPEEPEVFQVASGERNPLRYRDLYDIVRDYFVRNPLRDSGGRPIQVPEWSFPGPQAGRGAAQDRARRPQGGRHARLEDAGGPHGLRTPRQRIARAEKRARMSLYYSRIYGAYANMTATFSTSRTTALYEATAPGRPRGVPVRHRRGRLAGLDAGGAPARAHDPPEPQEAQEDDGREAGGGGRHLRRRRDAGRLQRRLVLRLAQDAGASCALASALARRVLDQDPLLLGAG